MNLSIVGIVGLPSSYGGFETLVENLLPLKGRIVVYCSKKSYDKKRKEYKGARLVYLPVDANGVQSILYDTLSILHTLFSTKNDLLILGVSGAITFPFLRLISKRRIIVNIDGLEWRRGKWGWFARKFLKFSEKLAVNHAHVVVTDNKAITSYVLDEYGVDSKTIAYGGDHALLQGCPREAKGYALSLCRIEPENNVELILLAFSERPNYQIKFVGNWDRSEFGRRLRLKYSQYANIELLDPIYDLKKLFDLRSACTFYVHGHSAGGTNPSLVEMMFFGKPILAFNCDYNRYSTHGKASYFNSSADLQGLFEYAQTTMDHGELSHIAQSEYTWDRIRDKYLEAIS